MSISAFYILNVLGNPLISRNYRGSHDPEIIEKFIVSLLEEEEEKETKPIFEAENVTFAFIKFNNLYFVCTINGNGNITLAFLFLYKIKQVMSDYFNLVKEESIRDNFVIIFELLDEVMDFGFPQVTESNILMKYITQESKKMCNQRAIPPAVTNAVFWRPEGINYRKNELFLDVVESINLLANANGTVVCGEIVGSIKLKAQLSGMPEVRLGLNDKLLLKNDDTEHGKSVDLGNVKFHQCVRLSEFENQRSIRFVPPDGEFELMSYRLNGYVKPPLWVECVTEYYPNNKVEYSLTVTSRLTSRFIANSVVILIPVPSDVDSPVFKTLAGTANYDPEKSIIKWSLKSLSGSVQVLLNAKFGLPSVENETRELIAPVQVEFQMSLFTISGLRVRFMKVVEKSGYNGISWVRYVTQNGSYQIRSKVVVHNRKCN